MPKKPMPTPNVTSRYQGNRSTTAVDPSVASYIRPDLSARTQLDALLEQEKKTGYRSPELATPVPSASYYQPPPQRVSAPSYGNYGNRQGGGGLMGSGEQRVPPAEEPPPEKWLSEIGYDGQVVRTINPAFEQWAAARGQFDIGPERYEVLPGPFAGGAASAYLGGYSSNTSGVGGAGAMGGASGSGAKGAGPGVGGGKPDWYDLPEWQRVQIMQQAGYGAGDMSQVPWGGSQEGGS